MKEESLGLAVLLLLLCGIVAAVAAQKGAFYTTGKQWFDSCWTAQNSKRQAASPDEAVSWGKCEKIASSAIYDAGFVFAGTDSLTAPSRAVAAACPSGWSDLPLGGVAVLGVNLVASDGGPSVRDRFTPARDLIVRAFVHRWPRCPLVRAQNNFPKLVEGAGGEFAWERPCEPCQLEERARQAKPPEDY